MILSEFVLSRYACGPEREIKWLTDVLLTILKGEILLF